MATPSGERASKLAEVVSTCAIDFPQSDYGDDANSPVNSWAVYDTRCAYKALVGSADLSVDPKTPSGGDVRLTEDVTSLYAMAEFSTEWGDIPVDGNFGVRYVQTDVESIGVRTSYTVLTDPNGFISFESNPDTVEFSTLTHDYTNVLPSVNVSLGLRDDLQLRLAAYAGLSRPDMWFFGAGRNIGSVTADEEFTSVQAALDGRVSAVGNPYLEALESNNYDVSLSYYMGADTMLSAALYYKTFSAAFESASDLESVVVDGTSYDVVVQGRPTIIDDNSSIVGYELSALHRFTSLPAPFDGLGVSVNYNYADSNFETPEAAADITADVREQITPSNIAGLSKHNFSSQIYWESDEFSARLSYKFRSEYLKPFGASLAQSNRIVDDTASVDLDLAYEINKNLKVKFQAINLTNEPYVEQRVAHEFYNRIEYSGARYFVGLQYRM
jgi:iron complex outermembrane recepter protein